MLNRFFKSTQNTLSSLTNLLRTITNQATENPRIFSLAVALSALQTANAYYAYICRYIDAKTGGLFIQGHSCAENPPASNFTQWCIDNPEIHGGNYVLAEG